MSTNENALIEMLLGSSGSTRSTHEGYPRRGRPVVADDITDIKGRLDRIDARLEQIESGSTLGEWHLI